MIMMLSCMKMSLETSYCFVIRVKSMFINVSRFSFGSERTATILLPLHSFQRLFLSRPAHLPAHLRLLQPPCRRANPTPHYFTVSTQALSPPPSSLPHWPQPPGLCHFSPSYHDASTLLCAQADYAPTHKPLTVPSFLGYIADQDHHPGCHARRVR